MHKKALLIQDLTELKVKLQGPIGHALLALPQHLKNYAMLGVMPRILWIVQREAALSGLPVDDFNKHSEVDNFVHQFVSNVLQEDLSLIYGNFILELDRRYGQYSVCHEIQGRDLYTYYYNE